MSEKVRYSCCVTVEGHTGDPQEGPLLYCPECGDEMAYDVFYERDGEWFAIVDGEWIPESELRANREGET